MQKQKGSKMVFGIAVQLYFKKNLSNFFNFKLFFMFFDRLSVLMLRIIYKNKKNIILIYF